MTIRVGLIGCGDWGRNHARALSRFAVLAAVSDADQIKAEDMATRFGCDTATPEEVFNNPAVDAVVIAVSPLEHARLAVQAMEAGKHVLVEKPMAMCAADARWINDTAKATGRMAMTGHIMRFHPAFVTLHKMVHDGDLGELLLAECHRKGFGKFFPGVSAIWDLAPHDLALLLSLTGAQPTRATGRYAKVVTENPDAADIHLSFEDGFRANIHLSRVYAGKERRLTLIGTQGTAVFDDLAPWPEKLVFARHGEAAEPVPFSETAPLDTEIRHFLECIRGEAMPQASAAHGLAVLNVLDQIEMSEVPVADLPLALAAEGEAPSPELETL